MRIFEHNFVADKAKIRRRAAARQGFLTQYAAKFAEKTCAYAYEDRFSGLPSNLSVIPDTIFIAETSIIVTAIKAEMTTKAAICASGQTVFFIALFPVTDDLIVAARCYHIHCRVQDSEQYKAAKRHYCKKSLVRQAEQHKQP